MSDSPVLLDPARYGPWALVLGGSEGIGSALAADLAAAKFNLVLVARKPDALAEAARDIKARFAVKVRTLSLDLTADDMLAQLRRVTDDVEIGLLVYNAGASHRTGPFVDWEMDDVIKVLKLNVIGQTVLAHHFGRKMADRGRGGIILMGSLAGNAGSPSVIPYAGAKAYSQIFSEGLWWEMKQAGVDVLHVVVGSTATPAMARLGIVYRKNEADQPEEVAGLALSELGKGPVTVVPSMRERFGQLATIDRQKATLSNAALVMGNTEGTWSKRGE